ncbi:c-type cytochrome [Rhodobacteraceae bacterium CCMM004]|nr:c-type cytochrome [Rhodobacteraceae bacterium CCMM004]
MAALIRWALFLGAVALAAGWWITRPERVDAAALAGLTPDLALGERTFVAAGCASCHVAPETSGGDGQPVLSGGQRFASEFGTFIAPNISSHPEHGIGAWSDEEIVTAVMKGVSPGGAHYYPAFPYTAYAKAAPAEILSLAAYLRTLPASDVPSLPHEVGFPFNIRRSVGGWKWLFTDEGWAVEGDLSPDAAAGRYLAEALGHCGECHTPRNPLGGLDISRWLQGAPNPSGRGRIPGIDPGSLTWSEADIAYYLETGFTPDFDTAGGSMVAVIDKTAQLTPDDRAAIAAYLKAVPPKVE